MDFAGGLGVEPPGLGTASADPQDDWMKEFEEPNAQFPELSSAPVSQSTDFASSTPLNPLEESWSPAVPPELGYSPENAGITGSENLLPPMSTDFQSQPSSDWSMSPNPLPSQNLAPTDWSDGLNSANTEPAYTGGLSLPEVGFAPTVEDTQFLGPSVASASSSLDTLWDSSFSETGTDLQSQFGPAEPVQPTWNITEPNLDTSDLSPDLAPLAFSEPVPPHRSLSQTDEAFDPLETSHALEAGWSQYGGMSPSLDEPETWQTTALPNLTSNASWQDEQVPAGEEWLPQAVGNAPEPVYFHEVPAEPESETQVWDNLNSLDFAPGEQVPYASGAMMDSINEQLYPEDPFTAQGEFAAGEQAFADAARYLFPETVNAPLDWADSGYGSVEDSESGFYEEEAEETPMLELGPSYSSQGDGFAELSSASLAGYTTASGLDQYAVPPQPEAFVGFAETQQVAGQPNFESAFNAEDEQWLSTTPVNEPAWSAGTASEPGLYQPSAQIEEQGLSSAAWTSQPVQEFEGNTPVAAEPATINEPMDYAWQSSGMEQVTGAEYGHPAPQPELRAQAPDMQTPLAEADFYATAFTLNELGELVPVHEDEIMQDFDVLNRLSSPVSEPFPQVSPPQAQAYDAISAQASVGQAHLSSQFSPVSQMPTRPQISPEQFLAAARTHIPLETNRPVIPPDRSPEPMQMTPPASSIPQTGDAAAVQPTLVKTPVPPEPVAEEARIRPKPLNRKMPEPMTAPESSLESQWYNPGESALDLTPPPSSSDMAMKLTLGNLEVVGICQLSMERRLLVVHHDGVYALMGQNGQEKADVNVLKVFEHNPLAYQHTFTAVEEANAAGQGMYVTQVGTWHAIISTFQDKITLHTELG